MGEQKDIALARPVHNRDILRIDELVYLYINGTKKEKRDAQEEILEYFDQYLEKYVNLFIGSQVDLNNYDTRGFLAMFLTGRPKNPANLAAQKNYISHVMSRFTREDVKNEMIVLFLGVLDKYRIYPGVNALNPLTKFFRYRVKDWFNRIVKDALFRIVDIDKFFGSDESQENITIENWLDRNVSVEVDFEERLTHFDLKWVRNPSEQIYKALTTYERYLLFLAYNQDLGIAQIAEKLERDKDTARRHLDVVFEKLRVALSEETSD